MTQSVLRDMQARWCDQLHALYDLAADTRDDAARDLILARAAGIERCDMDLRTARRELTGR